MLVGSPGLGKSQLASVIALEMATNFHEVLGQTISHPSDLNALLLASQDKDIIHIDECHELPKQMQTALYLALDKRCLVLSSKNGKPVLFYSPRHLLGQRAKPVRKPKSKPKHTSKHPDVIDGLDALGLSPTAAKLRQQSTSLP